MTFAPSMTRSKPSPKATASPAKTKNIRDEPTSGGVHHAKPDRQAWWDDPVLQSIREDPVGANENLLAERSSKTTVRAATKLAQQALGAWGIETLGRDVLQGTVPDGIFGSATKAAIIAFQAAEGLDQDAILGPLTLAELDQVVGPPDPGPNPNDPDSDPDSADPSKPKIKFEPIGDPDEIRDHDLHRIPPRTPTQIRVKVAGVDPENGPKVFLTTRGAGKAGRVSLNRGFDPVELKSGAQEVRLYGTQQTAPGAELRLRLVATIGDSVVAESPRFAVAAWPLAMEEQAATKMEGTHTTLDGIEGYAWAVDYKLAPMCETGVDSDCDKIAILEDIPAESRASEFMQKARASSQVENFGSNSDVVGLSYNPESRDLPWEGLSRALDNDRRKEHLPPEMAFNQQFRFADFRTGLPANPSARSDFLLIPYSGFFNTVSAHTPNFVDEDPKMGIITRGWRLKIARKEAGKRSGMQVKPGIATGETHTVGVDPDIK